MPAFANNEGECLVQQSSNQTVPSSLTVNQNHIHGLVPWFMTDADATDPNLEVQGKFLFGSSVESTEVIDFVLEVEVEFRDMFDPTVMTIDHIMARHERLATRGRASLVDSKEKEEDVLHLDEDGKTPLSQDELRILSKYRAVKNAQREISVKTETSNLHPLFSGKALSEN